MRTVVIRLASVAVVGWFAVALASADGQQALRIDGTWSISEVSIGPNKAPKEFLDKLKPTVVFNSEKYLVFRQDSLDEAGSYKLTKDKQSEFWTITLTVEKGNDKDKKQVGICKLEDDKLYLAFARPGNTTAPTDFGPNENFELQVMTRKK